MTSETHSPPHRSILRLAQSTWRRRKWVALPAFAAPFCAAVALIMTLPDLYRASATVLVTQELAPPGADRAVVGAEVEPRLQRISQEILSRARLQQLIERFDLYPTLRRREPPEVVIERMRKDIRLERQEVRQQQWGRNVTIAFTLSYQGWDPQRTADVVNTLTSFYVEENEKLRQRQAAGTQVIDTVDELTQRKRELTELRSRFSDRYPDVIRLRSEIAALERERARDEAAHPRAESTPRAAPSHAGPAGREFDAHSANEQRPHEAATHTPHDLYSLPTVSTLDRIRHTPEEYGAHRAPARGRPEVTTQRGNGEQFQILDSAIAPNLPFAPSRPRLLLMGLILALGFAGAVTILTEQMDTSFHRIDELWRYANMPILASIPRIVTRGDSWRRRLRFALVGAVTLGGLLLLVHGSMMLGRGSEPLVWLLAQRGA